MILSDKKILEAIASNEIVIEPFNRDYLGTNSYDVHLGKYLAVYKDHVLDAKKHNKVKGSLYEVTYAITRQSKLTSRKKR